jgi:hypothetical protein
MLLLHPQRPSQDQRQLRFRDHHIDSLIKSLLASNQALVATDLSTLLALHSSPQRHHQAAMAVVVLIFGLE